MYIVLITIVWVIYVSKSCYRQQLESFKECNNSSNEESIVLMSVSYIELLSLLNEFNI